jgi:phosphate transport system substrate-binding protein
MIRLRRPGPGRTAYCAGGVLLAALFVSGLSACSPLFGAEQGQPAVLRMAVADSCRELAESLVEAYRVERPWISVDMQVFNSAVAERQLREGQVGLALLAWVGDGRDSAGLWSQPFAPLALAVIANPSLAWEEATLEEVRAVFWANLRGLDGQPLQPVSREDGSGARALFEQTVLGGSQAAQTAVVMPSSESVLEYVENTAGAVGYVSTYVVADAAGGAVQVVAVDGVLPGGEAAADGSYPLSGWLRVAALGEPSGTAREFAQWLLGPEGQEVVWSR